MKIFSIIPDTNSLVDNLELLFNLTVIKGPFTIYIYISRVVIDELDKLKNYNANARRAIGLLSNTKSSNVIFEGDNKTDKIEVVIDNQNLINEQNNDDRILNYAKTLEEPFIITNDQNFILKCKMNGIYAINPREKTTEEILMNILSVSETEINTNEIVIDSYAIVKNEIRMKVREIVYNETGNFYVYDLQSNNFIDVLGLIIINFNIFQKYIPKNSYRHLKLLKKALIEKDNYKIQMYFEYVAFAFQILYKNN